MDLKEEQYPIIWDGGETVFEVIPESDERTKEMVGKFGIMVFGEEDGEGMMSFLGSIKFHDIDDLKLAVHGLEILQQALYRNAEFEECCGGGCCPDKAQANEISHPD